MVFLDRDCKEVWVGCGVVIFLVGKAEEVIDRIDTLVLSIRKMCIEIENRI